MQTKLGLGRQCSNSSSIVPQLSTPPQPAEQHRNLRRPPPPAIASLTPLPTRQPPSQRPQRARSAAETTPVTSLAMRQTCTNAHTQSRIKSANHLTDGMGLSWVLVPLRSATRSASRRSSFVSSERLSLQQRQQHEEDEKKKKSAQATAAQKLTSKNLPLPSSAHVLVPQAQNDQKKWARPTRAGKTIC